MKQSGRRLSKTIFLYIVRETLFSFLVCFLFFFFVFFVNQLLLMAGQILSKRVPFGQVALLVLYSLPSVVALAAPFASLSGTLMTIGKMSTDNEILVIFSSGISYFNVLFPALAVGVCISLVSFFANDILLPAGTVQFVRLYRNIAISSPGLEFGSNTVKRFRDTLVITGVVSKNTINDIIIMDRTAEGERRLILSKEASLRDSGRNRISIDLKDAFVQIGKENARENYDYASSSMLTYSVSQEDAVQAVYTPGPREMSSVDVAAEIKQKEIILAANINHEKRLLAGNALALESVLRIGTKGGNWNRLENLEEDFSSSLTAVESMKKDKGISVYRLEFYKKFSIPLGAFSFVFIAVTLGLMAKKNGQTVGFLVGIIISVVYWAMLLGGQTVGTNYGFSPFWSMWLPNILSLGTGLVLVIIRLRN
jgi:lipopolysaccharide export system permease protein